MAIGIFIRLMLFLGVTLAENVASLEGVVMDTKSVAVPGVEVIAKNTATQVTHRTKPDKQGHYTFQNLPIGIYDVLKALGMGIDFTKQANFEKMCTGPAFIDWVKHKAFADINEEGTEVAAVTVAKMKRGGLTTLVFDRTFFLAIRDNVTGSILFIGYIINP